jgi:HSP20 family protein
MVSLVRWDPFADLASVQRDMGRLVSDLGGWEIPAPRRLLENEALMLTPTIDVMRRGADMLVRAEIPGVKPEEVDISVTGNMLTLKGERREEHETKDEDFYMRESSYGTFVRTLRLPEGAEVDHIKAEVRDGILEITVPKAAHVAPETHHVAITAAPATEHPEHH